MTIHKGQGGVTDGITAELFHTGHAKLLCVTVVVYIACVGVSIGSHGGYGHVKENVYYMSCCVLC